jgi:hypothetical protein
MASALVNSDNSRCTSGRRDRHWRSTGSESHAVIISAQEMRILRAPARAPRWPICTLVHQFIADIHRHGPPRAGTNITASGQTTVAPSGLTALDVLAAESLPQASVRTQVDPDQPGTTTGLVGFKRLKRAQNLQEPRPSQRSRLSGFSSLADFSSRGRSLCTGID